LGRGGALEDPVLTDVSHEADEAFRRLMTLADDKLIREIGGLHTADLKKLVLGRVLAERQEPPRDEPPSEPMVAAR
jgi:hypothetical protein